MKIKNWFCFTPQLWPTIITLVCLGTVMTLGIWQLQRLAWKNQIITEVTAATSGEATPLPNPVPLLEDHEYRRVVLQGEFLHAHELHLAARYHRNQLGYHLLTPMRLQDQRVILVNRGFVPKDSVQPDTRPQSLVQGEQRFEAMLQAPRGKGLFTPDNDPDANMWFWVDMDAIKNSTGLALLPAVANAIQLETEGGLPIASTGKIEFRNDHFMYAITWFCLALAMMIIYISYHRMHHPRD